MKSYKCKVTLEGTIDKIKMRLCVQGNIRKQSLLQDNWLPTASHRIFKIWCVYASKCVTKIYQLDFIGVFLQAPLQSTTYVILPKFLAVILPEYAQYFGVPLWLINIMYSMSICGNNWFEELREWILSPVGGKFKKSTRKPVLFYREELDGSTTYFLAYVDDSLYFNSNYNDKNRKTFEKEIGNKFKVEFMGYAHWFLSLRIIQDAQKNILVDQSC